LWQHDEFLDDQPRVVYRRYPMAVVQQLYIDFERSKIVGLEGR
jgi:hypothetical protein